jgi:beta-lactamase superfamily II metal-dependent hydrolase
VQLHEVDFWSVSMTMKSGDAISLRFTDPVTSQNTVVVIDAGYTDFGSELADKIAEFYETRTVDLVISTHPDGDHINGIAKLIETLYLRELLLHRPSSRGYTSDVVGADCANELADVAEANGTIVTEPDQGLQRFGGALTILGPSEPFYVEMLQAQMEEEYWPTAKKAAAKALERLQAAAKTAIQKIRRIIASDPGETLTDDDGGTTSRNNTSVITLFNLDGHRLLLTGDAGVPALRGALDFMDTYRLGVNPLSFVQVPHHGSRHNVDAQLLDRLLGEPGVAPQNSITAFVSASEKDEDHPHPKVLNAFKRRGCRVQSTEGTDIWHHHNAPTRANYASLEPLPWYEESED